MSRWIGFLVGATIAGSILVGIGFHDANQPQTQVRHIKDSLVAADELRESSVQRRAVDLPKDFDKEQNATVHLPDKVKNTITDSALVKSKQPTILPNGASNSPVPEVIPHVTTAHTMATDHQLPTAVGNLNINLTESMPNVRKWHPVWQAFRSELSAKGFADHLARLTQHEYRVRRLSAWIYQVEFAHSGNTDLTLILQNIETKTGVELKQSP